jgi:CHAP domain
VKGTSPVLGRAVTAPAVLDRPRAGGSRAGTLGAGRRTAIRMRRRRRTVSLSVVSTVVTLGLVAFGVSVSSGSRVPPLPSTAFRAHIVTLAESQLGYETNPTQSYCNKYSAFWAAGTATNCGSGLRSEQWCADFAAWAWREAGAKFSYGYAPGDVNAASASFYLWAVDHGTWHPYGSGYTPQPGDVAVYGLDTAAGTAAHVAVVTYFTPGARGPDVVNGDGDRTGFSVVESGSDQYEADTPGTASPLSGYASPIPAAPADT